MDSVRWFSREDYRYSQLKPMRLGILSNAAICTGTLCGWPSLRSLRVVYE